MLQSALNSWFLEPEILPSLIALFAFACLVLPILALPLLLHRPSKRHPASLYKENNPPQLHRPAGEIATSFFENQFDFIKNGFKDTSSSVFQFKLNRHNVIALSGEEGRRTFFKEKGLDLYEAFQVIVGTIPTGLDPDELHSIYKRIGYLQRPDNLQYLIPLLLSDCKQEMDTWGSYGQLDPCSAIQDLTFQMIIRSVTSFDVADDPALVSQLRHYYHVIDSSFKPFSTMFPWLPGPSTARKLWASTNIYLTFKKAMHNRRRSGVHREDALQHLLDAGESDTGVIGFMSALPIAGGRATGTIGTWLIMFLSSNPDWAATVRNEIKTLLHTHNPTLSSSNSIETLTDALSAIPLTSWESQTPNLSLCLRETLRTAQPHTAIRKNIGPEFTIGRYTVPQGAFVAYPFADTFLDETYYPDATRWDPSRKLHPTEPYLGWGAGKHMCRGQRLASLTMKLVAVYALLRFDLAIVDDRGEILREPPVPDLNDVLTLRPKERCRIAFVERSAWSTALENSDGGIRSEAL